MLSSSLVTKLSSYRISINRYCHTLRLSNTFKKSKEVVTIAGQKVVVGCNPSAVNRTATVYCCGPTVYDDCHLGHGFNYIRFDLFRRILSVYCHVPLMVAMGVTDIDDKIIARAKREGVDPQVLANSFFESFKRDLKSLNVTSPHIYLRVTEHIQDVIEYIQTLEREGKAYVNEETLDVVFDNSSTPPFSQTYQIKENIDEAKAVGKRSPTDFVLWKKAKEGEPSFDYESPSKQSILPGRPGWHVECSSLINSVFGETIDFHYGGKDLIFPHHYSEAACCHAYSKSTSPSVTSWSSHWLHSGHLIHREEKMSKSIGNLVSIQDFLQQHHFNIVRLMCIKFHYRSDLRFCRDLINLAVEADKQLKHLVFFVVTGIGRKGRPGGVYPASEIESQIEAARDSIFAGLADDLDTNRGLEEILNLYRLLRTHQQESISAIIYIKVLLILQTWMSAMGLEYDLPPVLETLALSRPSESVDKTSRHIEMLMQIRSRIRALALDYRSSDKKKECAELLVISDSIRKYLDTKGYKIQDVMSTSSEASSSSSTRSSRN